ncbi:MAG: SCO family protein [Pseudomonadota bacterium]
MSDNPAQSPLWRKLLIGMAIAGLALITGFFAREWSQQKTAPELENATLYPSDFRPLPPLDLTADNGSRFSNEDLMGRWTLMFFGFTHCPDVCPNTLAVMAEAYEQLGDYQRDVQVVFVSVDPERDTLDKLGDYVGYFHKDFMGVTADEETLDEMAGRMNIFFEKETPDEHGNYEVNHSAAIFVINPEGRRHALMSAPHMPGAMGSDLKTMMEHY